MSIPVSDDDMSRWPQVLTYNLAGDLETITAHTQDKNGNPVLYVKTLGYSGSDLVTISAWVKV